VKNAGLSVLDFPKIITRKKEKAEIIITNHQKQELQHAQYHQRNF
jgi:hypothetical protein